MKQYRLWSRIAILGLLLWPQPATPLEAEVIQIQYRFAEEAVPIVQNLLSPRGTVTADTRTNSLVIVDTPEAIGTIREFLMRFDQPPVQLRIAVRMEAVSEKDAASARLDGTVSGDGWEVTVGDGRKDGIEATVDARKQATSRGASQSIVTQAGRPAYIRIAQDIPYRKSWDSLCRKYSRCRGGVAYQRVETGMDVNPRVVGDRVILDITPRVSDVASNGVIRYSGAVTQLDLPLGKWITFGGRDDQSREVLQAILSAGRGDATGTRQLSIRVDRLP